MLKNVRGSKDYLPEEQMIRNRIKSVLEDAFQRYAFMPLETTTICYLDLLSSKYAGGAEIMKEVYKLNDQGGRELGLRYDLTVPFAKIVGMNPNLQMPFKRYEIGKVYRDGPVKKGRLREFYQCDVDVVGVSSMIAEAEYMSMVFDVFEKLELDVYVSYNNRKLLYGILVGVGAEQDQINDGILALDKVEKIGKDGVRKELIAKEFSEEVIGRLFEIVDQKDSIDLEFFRTKFDNDFVKEGIAELEELNGFLETLGIKDKVRLNPFLARGLDIYTGTVFEIFISDGSMRSSIGAGGRYDKIIGAFLDNGKEYPAVGISFGLDVIYTVLLERQKGMKQSLIDVLVVPMGTESYSLKVANKLRESGYKVEVNLGGGKLKKIFNRADKNGVPYVIVVGENEVEKGEVSIKDMRTGESETVAVNDIGGFEGKSVSNGFQQPVSR